MTRSVSTSKRRFPIETPCVQVCVLDPATGWCVGCGRTGEEIGGWLGLTPRERRAVMAALPERMAALDAAPSPPAPR